ncbi:MAG: hypothetical protein K2M82_04685 [Lachnospiraceae bacterium]|nr:hypothetical protein [Lachnospiraceae bacterium]
MWKTLKPILTKPLIVLRSFIKFRLSLFKGLWFPKATPLVGVRRHRNTLPEGSGEGDKQTISHNKVKMGRTCCKWFSPTITCGTDK